MRDRPNAKTDERRLVPVEIHSHRYGSDRSSSIKIIEAPLVEGSKIRLDISIDLRKTSVIEIKPIRRSTKDTDGLIEDAIRLAHE